MKTPDGQQKNLLVARTMNVNQLTNFQLYEIIHNIQLDKVIRAAATSEFNLRKLSKEEIEEIIKRHDSLFQPVKDQPLDLKYKIVAFTIPFFWVIHILITSRYLARGQKRKWKEYWLFFCLGILTWSIATVVVGKYFLPRGLFHIINLLR